MSRGNLWVIFCLFILYGATIPFNFTLDLRVVSQHMAAVRWDPLVSPETGRRVSIPDVVQNVCFFLPFGALGVMAGRGPRFTIRRILWVTLLGAALSILVEVVQLFTLDRVTSVSDVTTNTTGAFLGALGANTVARAGSAIWSRATAAGLTENAAFRPWIAAALLVVIAAWEPFDVTLELGTLATKARALQHDVWQAGALTDEGIAIVHYALFGLATCLWLQAVRRRAVALWAAAVGVTAAVGLEGAQVAITSRMPGLEDAVVRAAGALAGVALWPLTRAYPARKFWLMLLIAGVAAGAAMQQLSPFEIAPAHRPFGLMPFFSDYAHTTFETLSHVFELVLLYAPLGFVWRHLAGSGRSGSLLGAMAVTLAIAWPIEYLQGWIVGRYPDLTDIAMSLVGCWVGFRVEQFAASQRSLTSSQPGG